MYPCSNITMDMKTQNANTDDADSAIISITGSREQNKKR